MNRKLKWAVRWMVSLGVLILLIIVAQSFFSSGADPQTSAPATQEAAVNASAPAPIDVSKLTAKEYMEAVFQACGKEDWETYRQLLPEETRNTPAMDGLGKYLAGVKIIQIGEARQVPGRNDRNVTVPGKIEMPSGELHELNVKLEYVPDYGQWVLKGGI